MNYSAELIDKWIEHTGQSATELANKLEVNRSLISRIRKNLQHLTNEQALYIAADLNLSEVEVLGRLMHDKAKSDKERAAWLKLCSHGLASVGLVVMLVRDCAYWPVMKRPTPVEL